VSVCIVAFVVVVKTSPTNDHPPMNSENDAEEAESPLNNQSSSVHVENECVTTTDSTSGSLQTSIQSVSKAMSRRQTKKFKSLQQKDYRVIHTRGVVTSEFRTLVDKVIDTTLPFTSPLERHLQSGDPPPVTIVSRQKKLLLRETKDSSRDSLEPPGASFIRPRGHLSTSVNSRAEGFIIPNYLRRLSYYVRQTRAMQMRNGSLIARLPKPEPRSKGPIIFGNTTPAPVDGNNNDDEVPILSRSTRPK
jgi:hypothetical protein